MTFESYTVAVLAILFIAALTRSTFGFGDAMVAMPLLSLLPGVDTATFAKPLVALLIAAISGIIFARNLRSIEWRSAWRMVFAAAAGIPLGLIFLTGVDEHFVKLALGLLVIAFSAFAIWQPKLPELKSDGPALLFGFVAGMLGGAYNTHGPPLVVFGALRRWSSQQFRATLQAYFFPAGLLIVVGDKVHGLWSPTMLQHFVYSVPLLVLAMLLGSYLNARLPIDRFQIWLHYLLLCMGGMLVIFSFR